MKAPVGLLSGRTVLRSKMEGLCPDKFQFVGGIGNLHGRDEFLPYWRKIRLQSRECCGPGMPGPYGCVR